MRRTLIGQTGTTVLSDDMIKHKLPKRQTVRYQYTKFSGRWMAWVCGPFHSRTYGVCAFGSHKNIAKRALETLLVNDYGYHAGMMLSAVDDASGFRW